jgi:hypothetical protein
MCTYFSHIIDCCSLSVHVRCKASFSGRLPGLQCKILTRMLFSSNAEHASPQGIPYFWLPVFDVFFSLFGFEILYYIRSRETIHTYMFGYAPLYKN